MNCFRCWPPQVGAITLAWFVCLAPAFSQERERQQIPPGDQPMEDPFFQPEPNETFQNLPPVLTQEGAEALPFHQPESFDLLDSLPTVLKFDGTPGEEIDEAIWEREFAASQPQQEEEESWVQSRGYLEYRGSYTTNVDLSAPEIDTDLRRLGFTPMSVMRDTEVSDWINEMYFGYDHEVEVIPNFMKWSFRYDLIERYYADETREDNSRHRFELATTQQLAEGLEWEVFTGYENDEVKATAQYLKQDYEQTHVGTEVRKDFGEGKALVLGYMYRNRHYESIPMGLATAPESPWEDWKEHRGWARYSHPICESLKLELGLNFANRDHNSMALEADGAQIPGEFRKYDLWEPLVALTFFPNDNDLVTVFYRFRGLSSTGSFYDYDQNSVGVIYEHQILPKCFEGLLFRSEFEYAHRDYDAQIANRDDPSTGVSTPKSGSRDDDRYTLYLALEKTFNESWKAGVDFHYLDNKSDDDSSRYQEDRYGVYVRHDF